MRPDLCFGFLLFLVSCAAGPVTLIEADTEDPGENCPNGGTVVRLGADDDGNGSLGDGEVDEETYVCSGRDGVDGTNGTNGTNGTSAAPLLSTATPEAPGANCPAGGYRIDLGLDINGNGVLDSNEQMTPVYVCDGADGQDGAAGDTGPAGADGRDAMVTVTQVDVGDLNCPNGGYLLRAGTDDDGDGTLDAGAIGSTTDEVDYEEYVCNGRNGSNGTGGGGGGGGTGSGTVTGTDTGTDTGSGTDPATGTGLSISGTITVASVDATRTCTLKVYAASAGTCSNAGSPIAQTSLVGTNCPTTTTSANFSVSNLARDTGTWSLLEPVCLYVDVTPGPQTLNDSAGASRAVAEGTALTGVSFSAGGGTGGGGGGTGGGGGGGGGGAFTTNLRGYVTLTSATAGTPTSCAIHVKAPVGGACPTTEPMGDELNPATTASACPTSTGVPTYYEANGVTLRDVAGTSTSVCVYMEPVVGTTRGTNTLETAGVPRTVTSASTSTGVDFSISNGTNTGTGTGTGGGNTFSVTGTIALASGAPTPSGSETCKLWVLRQDSGSCSIPTDANGNPDMSQTTRWVKSADIVCPGSTSTRALTNLANASGTSVTGLDFGPGAAGPMRVCLVAQMLGGTYNTVLGTGASLPTEVSLGSTVGPVTFSVTAPASGGGGGTGGGGGGSGNMVSVSGQISPVGGSFGANHTCKLFTRAPTANGCVYPPGTQVQNNPSTTITCPGSTKTFGQAGATDHAGNPASTSPVSVDAGTGTDYCLMVEVTDTSLTSNNLSVSTETSTSPRVTSVTSVTDASFNATLPGGTGGGSGGNSGTSTPFTVSGTVTTAQAPNSPMCGLKVTRRPSSGSCSLAQSGSNDPLSLTVYQTVTAGQCLTNASATSCEMVSITCPTGAGDAGKATLTNVALDSQGNSPVCLYIAIREGSGGIGHYAAPVESGYPVASGGPLEIPWAVTLQR